MSKCHNSDDNTLNYVYEIIKEGVWDWDANTGHVNRSPGWYRMLGYDVDSLAKNVFTWENIIHPEDYPRVMAIFDEYITGNRDNYEVQYRCKKENGDYLWITDQGKIVARNGDGSVARMIGAHNSIHEQKLAQETLQRQNIALTQNNLDLENIIQLRTLELEETNKRLERQVESSSLDANTDSLTKLYNRRKYEAELKKEIARAKRYNTPLSLALLDADHFKKINDTFGHATGDKTLKNIAEAITLHIRENDIASRWGGEEFALIFPGTTLEGAEATAEKIRNCIAETPIKNQESVTCSVGLTQLTSSDTYDLLVRRLDRALYDAKASGRNCIRHQ